MQHLSESLPLPLVLLSTDRQIVAANPAACHQFRLTEGALVGRSVMELFATAGDNQERARTLLTRDRVEGKEVQLAVPAEVPRWARVHLWPVTLPDGRSGLSLLIVDATEQVAEHLRLEESETRFRTLGDSAPVLLWMSGTDGGCTFFNQKWLEFTGRPLEMEIGEGWAENVHPEDFQDCMHTYTGAFGKRSPFRMEYRLRRADGVYRWLLDTGLPRWLGDGSFAGYIGSCIDVTDLRSATELLRNRAADAQAQVRARDEFLSVASHELRTPLSTVTLELSSAQSTLDRSDPDRDAKLRAKMQRAQKGVTRLGKLVNNLLDVSRISAGRMRLECQRCDMVDMVREVVEGAAESAHGAGSQVRVRSDGPAVGHWDPVRIHQVLDNLVVNALKYGESKPVEISVEQDPDTIFVKVRDHGIGIAPHDIERIFSRFERAVSSRNYGGLGLGLYISKQIAAAHGGAVTASSSPTQGALFTLALPRHPHITVTPVPADPDIEG